MDWPPFVTRDRVVLWNSQTFISVVKTFHRKWLSVLICCQLSAKKSKHKAKGPHLKKYRVTAKLRTILIIRGYMKLKWFTVQVLKRQTLGMGTQFTVLFYVIDFGFHLPLWKPWHFWQSYKQQTWPQKQWKARVRDWMTNGSHDRIFYN